MTVAAQDLILRYYTRLAPALLVSGYAVVTVAYYAIMSFTLSLMTLTNCDLCPIRYFYSKATVQVLLTLGLFLAVKIYFKAADESLPIDEEVRTIMQSPLKAGPDGEETETLRGYGFAI